MVFPDFGSDYNFGRFTYTFRKYYPLHRDLILATRVFFEDLTGNIPFYELGATGGSHPTLDFGGSRFLRGYDGNRFVSIRFVSLWEPSYDGTPCSFSSQNRISSIGLVPFIDFGRVWPSVLPISVGDFHASGGFWREAYLE